MKFIHAADLHIDSPLRGLDAHDGAPAARLRGASRAAFVALVELALERGVDLVVFAGDIYDGNWTDFRTGLFFREQLVRLTKTGIRVVVAKGNHDAESVITRQLPSVEGVHVLSSRTAETVDFADLGVAVHGRSFPERSVTEDLVPRYPQPLPGRFNIGVLHTSLTGSTLHDTYAPTSAAVLKARGYDYFALGHIHERQVVREADPRIVFPGNLQGRHANECGAKGCEVVEVAGGRIVGAEFVPLDVVRWHRLAIDATAIDGIDALAARFRAVLDAATAGARDRLHAVRVRIEGESALDAVEAADPGALAAALRAAAQEADGVEVWVERVQVELRSPLDRGAAALRADAVGEVVRLVDELLADDAALAGWAQRALRDLNGLPAGLADAEPARLDAAALRAALAEAESSVLAQFAPEAPAAGNGA